MTMWKVILEGDGERPPTVLTDEVPSAFVAVPHPGDHIEGPGARFIVTCVAHCEEVPEMAEQVRAQLERLAAQPSPTKQHPMGGEGMIAAGMRVETSAMAVIARHQLQPRPLCKIYVVKAPTP